MVPWAGRVRDGQFGFDGEVCQLELDLPPHAIHGVGHRASWDETAPGALRLSMEGLWPFGGWAEQRVEVSDQSLVVSMSVRATQRMPAMAGWHPCFRRQLSQGGQAELSFSAGHMWQRDDTGIPTGERVPVSPGPWDDCFGGVTTPPVVRWPGFGSVRMESNMTSWVVYDEEPDVICVEPQSDVPNAFNRGPTVLEPGETLDVWMKFSWELEG